MDSSDQDLRMDKTSDGREERTNRTSRREVQIPRPPFVSKNVDRHGAMGEVSESKIRFPWGLQILGHITHRWGRPDRRYDLRRSKRSSDMIRDWGRSEHGDPLNCRASQYRARTTRLQPTEGEVRPNTRWEDRGCFCLTPVRAISCDWRRKNGFIVFCDAHLERRSFIFLWAGGAGFLLHL